MRHPAMSLLFLAALLACVAPQTRSQDAALRTVSGAAVDKNENGIPSAVVYLKNVRTLTVKTYIADTKGEYRFSGLDPNVDYEIHAEKDGAKSQTRTISSFDSKKEIILNLKIDKKKG